jgi:hypothetical protein
VKPKASAILCKKAFNVSLVKNRVKSKNKINTLLERLHPTQMFIHPKIELANKQQKRFYEMKGKVCSPLSSPLYNCSPAKGRGK